MSTAAETGGNKSPAEALLDMQARHAQTLKDWGLVHKAQRQVVERAKGRQVEDDLLDAIPLILGSSNDQVSCLFLGFQRRATDESMHTKLVLIGTKQSMNDYYIPDPESYFDDTDCRVASELFSELVELKQSIMPNYDLQFGIVR